MSLLRTTRGGKPVAYELTNGGILLGTAPGCQIVVADPAAAPKHCRIARSPQGFVVTDLSGGGTVVNGAKVKEHVLKHGDVLQIGAEKFTFAEKSPEPVAVAAGPSTSSGPSGSGPAANGGRRPLPSRTPRPAPKLQSGKPAGAAPGTGPVKKLTAKPGSVARVHKDHHVFALPSTRKGKSVAIFVGVGLVVLGGALFAISSNTVNSEQVKKEAEERIKALEAIPETDYDKRYEMAQDIASNANYQKYALKEYNQAAKLIPGLKSQRELEARAVQQAKPFIENYKSLKETSPEEYKKQLNSLYDTVKVHLENFDRTRLAPELTAIRNELKTLLENVGPSWYEEFVKLSREVSRLRNSGNFNQAMIEINTFGEKFGENESNQLRGKLQELRDDTKAEAKSYVEKLKKEAGEKPTREEKRKHLEAARPFIKVFPDVEKLLDRYLNEFK